MPEGSRPSGNLFIRVRSPGFGRETPVGRLRNIRSHKKNFVKIVRIDERKTGGASSCIGGEGRGILPFTVIFAGCIMPAFKGLGKKTSQRSPYNFRYFIGLTINAKRV